MTRPDPLVALEFVGVVKRVRDKTVLSGVSGRFLAGEMTLVRAARGAGKTTFARLAAGQTAPERGRIRAAGTPAPLVGSAWGFQSGAPVRLGLELRAASYGVSLRDYTARIAALLDAPAVLDGEFGALVGRDRAVLVHAAAWLIPSPVYVIDGAPLPADRLVRPKLAPLLDAARARAAVIWIAEEQTKAEAYAPEREARLEDGRLRFEPVGG